MEAAAPLPHRLPLERARLHLGSLLLRAGLLSAEQLEEALAEKAETGKRLGEIVVDRGWVPTRPISRTRSPSSITRVRRPDAAEIEDAAASLLPERLARRYRAVPVRFIDEDKCSSPSPTRPTCSPPTTCGSRSA